MKVIKWFLSIVAIGLGIKLLLNDRLVLGVLSIIYGVFFNPKINYDFVELISKNPSKLLRYSFNIVLTIFYFIIILPFASDAEKEIEIERINEHNLNAQDLVKKANQLIGQGDIESAYAIILSARKDLSTSSSTDVREILNKIDGLFVSRFLTKLEKMNLDSAKYYIDLYRKMNDLSSYREEWDTGISKYDNWISDEKNYNSTEFMKSIFEKMDNKTFNKLKSGALDSLFLTTSHYNKLFLKKLKNNLKVGKYVIDSIQVSNQFSAWNGSHYKFVEVIKSRMNDDKSFEHVETRSSGKSALENGDSIFLIEMTYKGTNKFGGIVKNTSFARSSISGKTFYIVQ